ncbi:MULTISPECIES: hypothetical protein [unclassified Pedobacter]|uniref:hypothetical protein n=1 Tax=unclassified Pedobacter TaxID=2628915 RepID=UPI001DDDB8CF|nr:MULTISPECIES: hypothetical protein [unclassified Pedobacter]CAH0186329.1 hypothetical protein SRABI36_01636 [Pedobacter sp. Bi36]CAH0242087.1 hypothetical protein SRABI126_02729 [Pedobacter sp. Bi126]
MENLNNDHYGQVVSSDNISNSYNVAVISSVEDALVAAKPNKRIIQSKADLSDAARNRRWALLPYYKDEYIFPILNNLEQYKLNTWKQVMAKVEFIHEGKHDTDYFNAIASQIVVGKVSLTEDIVPFIIGLRRSLKLPAYIGNIEKSCIADFLQMHMAEIVYSSHQDSKGQQQIDGYLPIISLLDQNN